MTTSPSLSARLQRLSSRERRVLVAGAVISVLIVLATTVVVPVADRWRDREAAIAARADQAARLEALLAGRSALEASAATLRDVRGRKGRALLDGGTAALAGSSLQSLVRGYGERSRISIQRLDPARSATSSGLAAAPGGASPRGAEAEESVASALRPVALTLTAAGDVYGLVDLLYYLQSGEKLLVVDDLRVTAVRAPRTDASLSWTLRVRGFFAPGEAGA